MKADQLTYPAASMSFMFCEEAQSQLMRWKTMKISQVNICSTHMCMNARSSHTHMHHTCAFMYHIHTSMYRCTLSYAHTHTCMHHTHAHAHMHHAHTSIHECTLSCTHAHMPMVDEVMLSALPALPHCSRLKREHTLLLSC